ncbi:protein STRUBBELIG-RECEPTOR FAMILY 7-like [Andrographis paniculata]|uniref:protein STRUBBELIG-RECEPTOR FAMILY 7-like n=1 Tax=Andrographis paniculata TaxID=175694 RepID=UPI0021E7D59E|nr:protein STRUBBELIG-RECEPTOR FAMILY 7-like [Andrographis paniculata]
MGMATLLLLLLVGTLSFVSAYTDPTDAATLNLLYTSLNSPLRQLTNWKPSGGDPCTEAWRGVACSGSRVTQIDLSGLGLTGNMGFQLDKLTAVTAFDISNNNLINQIPYQLPPNAQILNLAGNGFSADLPFSLSSMTSLKYLNVSHNQIQDQVNVQFNSLTALSTLDLSYNAMAGDIPQSFQSMTSLHDLYLQNNQFTGTLDVLADLPLKNLNVENNRFTGSIPELLKGINLHAKGNSFNTGLAPPHQPGTPPVRVPNSSRRSTGNQDSENGGSKSGLGAGAIAGIIISLLVVGAVAVFFIIKWQFRKSSTDTEKLYNHPFVNRASKERQEIDPVQTPSRTGANAHENPVVINLKPPSLAQSRPFDDEDGAFAMPVVSSNKVNKAPIDVMHFSVADLQIATDNFNAENLIGEGSIGRVYRARLNDGKILAVKKVNSSVVANSEDFLEIVSEISRLKHPNVTELVGYYCGHGQHLLLYEFHENGSLYEHLHLRDEFSKTIIWSKRVKIALGTARALEYLHEVCAPAVVHNNITTANILLDMDLNPHLTDCGLARFVLESDQARGYSAPKVSMSGRRTVKSDVYSFGVVLLELLTGRKQFDGSRPRSEQSLVQWATPQLHDIDALSKMADPDLSGLYPIKSLSSFAEAIALCVQREPEFRPPMSEVVQALGGLVQGAKMSKRTHGRQSESESEQGGASRAAAIVGVVDGGVC